jgi:cation transport ATPase
MSATDVTRHGGVTQARVNLATARADVVVDPARPAGVLSPIIAGAAMVFSSVSVVSSPSRLRGFARASSTRRLRASAPAR